MKYDDFYPMQTTTYVQVDRKTTEGDLMKKAGIISGGMSLTPSKHEDGSFLLRENEVIEVELVIEYAMPTDNGLSLLCSYNLNLLIFFAF